MKDIVMPPQGGGFGAATEQAPPLESSGFLTTMREHIHGWAGRMAAVGSLAIGLSATSLATEMTNSPAHAESVNYDPATGNYPDADAAPTPVTEANPATSDYMKNGSIFSLRGYGHRNCTDYVAWRVEAEGLSSGQSMRGLGNASTWDDRAGAHGWAVHPNTDTPEAGDIATRDGGYGHVAFVEIVHDDNTLDIAQYNQTLRGTFTRQLHVPVNAFDHYIDLNGANPPGFALQLRAPGTPTPEQPPAAVPSPAESAPAAPEPTEAAPVSAAETFQAIPDGQYIKSDGGNWYKKLGGTLQWVTGSDELAASLGIANSRYGADKIYGSDVIQAHEESQIYPWDKRAQDFASGKIDLNQHPIDRGFTLEAIRSAAQNLGFDDITVDNPEPAKGNFIPDAKSIHLVKNGQRYDANMDLIARLITGKDVFAYPSSWGDYRSWNAYPMSPA
jgi:surface antigen